MKNGLISRFEKRQQEQKKLPLHPEFRPGDSLRVHYKLEEAGKPGEERKTRIQIFEGVCTRFKKGTFDSTFTVRKVGANSVGVERTFPLHSPFVSKVDLLSGGLVRRARLYYLRELSGKAARIKARRLPTWYRTTSTPA